MKRAKNIEIYFIMTEPAGSVMYSDKDDKYITAVAHYYKRKVKTERLITVCHNVGEATGYILKITIL